MYTLFYFKHICLEALPHSYHLLTMHCLCSVILPNQYLLKVTTKHQHLIPKQEAVFTIGKLESENSRQTSYFSFNKRLLHVKSQLSTYTMNNWCYCTTEELVRNANSCHCLENSSIAYNFQIKNWLRNDFLCISGVHNKKMQLDGGSWRWEAVQKYL